MFEQINSGLELGLFALVSGLYRQAYGSLRLAVELTAGVCWFSTHRLDLAEWQSGERDLIWKEITNDEEGVLSPRFRKAFFPELTEERKYNGLSTYMVVTTVQLSLRYLQKVGDGNIERLAPNLRSRVGHVSAITKYLDERLPAPAAAAPGAVPAPVPAPGVAAPGPVPAPAVPGTNGPQDTN